MTISTPRELRIAYTTGRRLQQLANGHRRNGRATHASSAQARSAQWFSIYNAAARQFARRNNLDPAAVRRWVRMTAEVSS